MVKIRFWCGSRLAFYSVAFLTFSWCLILLPSILFSEGWNAAGALLHASLRPICHQIPDRCFHWLGYPLPICARCLGMLSGFTLGWTAALGFESVRRSCLPDRRWLWTSLGLLALDAFSPFFFPNVQTHWTRFLSGFFFGLLFAPYAHLGAREVSEEFSRKQQGAVTL